MIKNIELLSLQDKLFMIKNRNCFSNSTKSSINFNSENWNSQINSSLDTNTINKIENMSDSVKSVMFSSMRNFSKPEAVKKFVDELCKDVIMETPENIVDFMIYCKNNIRNLQKKCNLDPDQVGKIYEALYISYIPWKIMANVIYNKTQREIQSSDKGLMNYLNNINKILFSEIGTTRESYASALVIKDLMDNLNITMKDKSCVEFLLDGKKYYNHEDSSSIKNILEKLLDSKVSALNIIDRVSSSDLGEFGDKLLQFSKRKIEENYIKSKISKEVNNEILCIGDDVFPDHEPMNIGDLLIELDKLDDDEIKNYIGSDKNIIYTIDENDNGYIKKGLKAPMCKVLRKERGMNTLAKINNTSFLIFKVYGEDVVYGISFPPSNGGIRKLITIDVPKGANFLMK